MSNPNPETEDPEIFSDAIDDFQFFDCISTDQLDTTTSHAQPDPERNPSSVAGLRRRPLSQQEDPEPSNLESLRFRQNVEENDVRTSVEETNDGSRVDDSVESEQRVGNPSVEFDNGWSSFLVYLADLTVRAIRFQVTLLLGFISVPHSVLYQCSMFCVDQFCVFRYLLVYCKRKIRKLWDVVFGLVRFFYGLVKRKYLVSELALRCGYGLYWLVYVLVILGGLFVVSLLFGIIVVKLLVAGPVQVKEVLNFDYTKNTPVAYVPLVSCVGVGGDGSCKEKSESGKLLAPRIIPHNHKTQVTVSLTLPESSYNRNLGIFQVRVDFLSPCGRTLASSSHLFMLRLKRKPIRLFRALLQAVPLAGRYVSDSQTLEVKFTGFREGDVPTSCIRVLLLQRAEFRSGGGIPEIYDASVVVESELPLLRRIIWSWQKTIFLWVSVTSFMMELILTLFCCRREIIPRLRLRERLH